MTARSVDVKAQDVRWTVREAAGRLEVFLSTVRRVLARHPLERASQKPLIGRGDSRLETLTQRVGVLLQEWLDRDQCLFRIPADHDVADVGLAGGLQVGHRRLRRMGLERPRHVPWHRFDTVLQILNGHAGWVMNSIQGTSA